MRSLSLADRLKSVENKEIAHQISTFYKTVATIDSSNQLEQNLKNKIKTFTKWKASESLPKKKNNQESFQFLKQNTDNKTPVHHLLGFIIEQVKQKQKKGAKKALVIEELEGIKTDRRQRFKRLQNPQQIIIHYVKHQGFKPSKQEEALLYRIVKLKSKLDSIQPFNLQIALEHIVKTMNMAVDFNRTQFLILLIMLAGEICFEAKEFKTSFFFFTQAIVASTCTMQWPTKLEALLYMGRICLQIMEYQNSILFFKKALQYAWKVNDRQTELRIYDLLGEAHYYQGKCESAMYYHNRYILGQCAKKISAVLRMSAQMLKQYEKTIDNTEKENLSQLFLDYLRLPITNFSFYPPMRVEQIPENYVGNTSPRKNRKDFRFNYKDLPEAKFQVEKVLRQFNDFRTQIPNPDLYRNFVATQKYGKARKNIQFQQSHDYHKIFGVQMKQFDKSLLKLPIDQKITSILAQKPKPDWWQQIVTRSKKQRSQKIGGIRNKVYKRHLSFQESEKVKIENKRRQAISQSMNKTILNWIDPPKKFK